MAPKVVVALLSEEQEFQRLQAADARLAAERAGLDVEVLFAENNAIVQIQQLFHFVYTPEPDRPVAIVVETVTGEGLERVARNAVKAGVGWVLINRKVAYLDELRRQHPDLPISMVSTDQEEIGRIQARQFRALLPKGGAVLYIQGPGDTSAAKDRLEGMKEGTTGAGMELRVLNGDWSVESGEKAVSSWLRLKTSEGFRPDLLGSQNDAMAVGARKAIQALRPEWSRLPFTGCDGLPDGGQRLVAQGHLAATVITPSNTGPALDLVARWLQDRQGLPREVVLAPRSHPPETQIRPSGAR